MKSDGMEQIMNVLPVGVFLVIVPDKIKKSQAKKLLKLVEEETRAEIMSRHGRFENLEFANYYQIKLDKQDKIRKLCFGSSDLVRLGIKWGLLKEKEKKRRKKKKSLRKP